MSAITKGNCTLHFYPNGVLAQIIWRAPAARDDDSKIRCPVGFITLRLWPQSPLWTLSQGIKAMLGGGDIPLRNNIRINEKKVINMSGDELEEFIFTLKGDYDLLDDQGL